jgi:hypothetical protein
MSKIGNNSQKCVLKLAKIGFVVALSLQTLACSHQNFTRSGFLTDYDKLKKTAENGKMETYVKNGADWSGYGKVIVEPVVYRPPSGKEAKLSSDEERKITSSFHECFVTNFTKDGITVVAEPQNGVLRIRSAVTGIDTSNPFINVVSTLAVFLPVDNGGASAEIEVLDSLTSERLAAFVFYDNGKPWQLLGFFTKFGHAEAAFDKWVGNVCTVITQNRTRKENNGGDTSDLAHKLKADPANGGS